MKSKNPYYWMIQRTSVINMTDGIEFYDYIVQKFLKSIRYTPEEKLAKGLLADEYTSLEEADQASDKMNAVAEVLQT